MLALSLGLGGLAMSAQPAPDINRAQTGDAQAQYDLAAAYFQGTGDITRNIPRALEWLEKAAAQGHIAASYRLGEIYYHGHGGVQPDLEKAANAFRRPAVADYMEAKVYLGYLYFTGQGVPVDEERGIALLREAAARGLEPAWKLLWEAFANSNLEPLHEAELSGMLEAGVAAGDLRAKETLGLRLMLGQDGTRNVERARTLLPEAAERGSVLAASALAQDLGERLGGPDAAGLTPRQRTDLDVQFKRMVHLIAVHGGAQGRDTCIRVITRLVPLAQLAPKEADGSIVVSDDLVAALAWARIHRGDPAAAPEILAWARAGEAWIADYTRIRERVANRERSLRSELERAGPKTP
jgi:TPR repeat protein